MKQFLQCMLAASLLMTGGAASAQKCKPTVGHFEAVIVPPGQGHCPNVPNAFCTAGRVWGGIQGNYQFVMSSLAPSGPTGVATVFFYTGESTVFLKSGDQVVGTDTGSLDLPPGQGGFASVITFHGGTGRMSGATGQLRLRGELGADGTTSGDYIGGLCSP